MGGGHQPADAGDGVSRVYSPYNPADDPVLKAPTTGGIKWGAGGASQSATSSTPLGTSMGASGIGSSQPGGSTYNITNNNNINYNYGSNITAISSDGGGPVPTFHDVDKAKKAAEKAAGPRSYASGALGYLGASIGSIGSSASAVGSSTSKGLGVSSGLGQVAQTLQTSKGLAQVSDSIKRTTGLDFHRAIGGKTAVQIAEERLKKEQEEQRSTPGAGYSGGYQGISIPLTPAIGTESKVDGSGAATYQGAGEKVNATSTSKYSQQWGPSGQPGASAAEKPALVQTQKLF